ncbi:MAG: biotin/lipoyl-binding protein [Prevotellaceae bacterium]|jgi:biotin carboxyl carrier protein|nr:biotin/lipoyl-binding protein [Prevotellaceae bacterium]
MKKFRFKIKDQVYDVAVDSLENNLLELNVNGKKYSVELEEEVVTPKKDVQIETDKKPVPPKKELLPASVSERTEVVRITAPLPGSIVRIIAKEGSVVKNGDALLVMESMKMENNILADANGTIKKIHVTAGQNVMQDDVLVEIG